MQDSKNNTDMLAHNNDEMAKNIEQVSIKTDEDIILSESTEENLATSQNTNDNYDDSNDIYYYSNATQDATILDIQNTNNNQDSSEITSVELQDNDYINTDNQIPLDILAIEHTDSNNANQEMLKTETNKNLESGNMQYSDNVEMETKSTKLQNNIKDMQDFTQKDENTHKNKGESQANNPNSQKKNAKKQKKRKRVKQQKHKFRYIVYYKRVFIALILIVCFAAIYVGYLLFGSTSFEVLWKLHQTRNNLRIEVEQSRIYNATLQRKVLELKALEPK